MYGKQTYQQVTLLLDSVVYLAGKGDIKALQALLESCLHIIADDDTPRDDSLAMLISETRDLLGKHWHPEVRK